MIRIVLAAVLAAIALHVAGPVPAQAEDTVTLTDLAGREVRVRVPVGKMILGEGRFLPSLAILEPEAPERRVAGMMGEFARYDPATYAQYLKAFPAIADIPVLGRGSTASFSLEAAIDAAPDVAIFSLGGVHGPGPHDEDIVGRLQAAGIPVLFIDFRIDPLVNTPRSIELLARLLGREARGRDFLAFYAQNLQRVRAGLDGLEARPSVFMEIRVGLRQDCCEAMGRQMMGRFIDWAGGRNHVGEKIPGTHGMVSLEYLLTRQPDHYVGTAIGNAGGRTAPGRIVLGAGAGEDEARSSLAAALTRPGFGELDAVKRGRAFALWHHFYNTPLNVVAVQALAKQLHPERFRDLDPRATLEAFFARFQPFPVDGTYWVALTPDAAG